MNISLQILVDVEKEMGKLLSAQKALRKKMDVPEFIENLELTHNAMVAHIRLRACLTSLLNQQVEVTNDAA
jgi:hypothetical protein